jgi:hypothetical protein
MLTTAALIAAALTVEGLLLGLWSTGIDVAGFGIPVGQFFGPNLFWALLVDLLHYAAFGLGVYLALRYFAPVGVEVSWRQTINRAIIATVVGGVLAFALAALVSLIAAVTIGSYPFGYSLNAVLDGNRITFGIQSAVAGALTPLIQWLPITVLGVVFLKLWLAAHPAALEPRGRASVSA